MVDSQTIVSHRVRNIVAEFTQFSVKRLDAGVKRRVYGRVLIIHPESIVCRSCCTISHKDVVRMSDPEVTRCSVSVEEREGRIGSCDYVVSNVIFGFIGILHEDCVSHAVPVTVPFNSQIVDAMNSRSSVETVHQSISSHIRFGDSTDLMVMDRVSAIHEGLANMGELQVFDSANGSIVFRGGKHYSGTELIVRRCFWVTPEHNISVHEAYFSSNSQSIRTMILHCSIVHVGECCIQSQCTLII
jgi:hypothetical protein